MKISLTFLILLMVVNDSLSANEDDNPVAFLRFEHHELSKETFLNEQKLVESLKNIRQMLDKRRNAIKQFSTKVRGRNTVSTESKVHDTISAFSLLKRGALILPTIQSSFKKDLELFPQILTSLNETSSDFPDQEDFNGAVKGMVMLHETYEFHLDSTTEGKIVYLTSDQMFKEFQGREKLQVDDLYLMSEKAKSQLLYDVGIEFLRAGFILADKVKPTNSTMKKMKTLRKQLIHMNNQHLLKWEKMLGPNYKVLPYLVDENMYYKQHQPELLMENVRKIEINNEYQKDFCFKQVCRSSAFTRQPDSINLPKCGYLHHFDPYLRLGPFKVEVILRSPYLSILHDVLTEAEINWMLDYSKPRLSRVRGNFGEIVPKHESRDRNKRRSVHKTVQCWIGDIEYPKYNEDNDLTNYTIHYPLMFKLAQKFELATQMNVTGKYSSTEFQTTNYGLGGLCEKHLDPHGYIEGAEAKGLNKGLVQSGDMLGTVMAWLGDVEGGGATAFLHNHVERALMPTRGSVAFWYDLDAKGFRDYRTLHGGCPIIKGTKWILNKWIFYYNQVKKFPCALNPKQHFPPPKGHYKNILS
jgi:prolyl 4-hydroxylase